MPDNVFYTRLSGQIFSLHFYYKRISNNTFYTNSKNVLYTVVESMVYYTLVTIVYFPLVKLRFVIYTNTFKFLLFSTNAHLYKLRTNPTKLSSR